MTDTTTPTAIAGWIFLERGLADTDITPDFETLAACHEPGTLIYIAEDDAAIVSEDPDPRSADISQSDNFIAADVEDYLLLWIETTGRRAPGGAIEFRIVRSESVLEAILPTKGRLRDVVVKLENAMTNHWWVHPHTGPQSSFLQAYQRRPDDFGTADGTYEEYRDGVHAANKALRDDFYASGSRHTHSRIPALTSCQHGDEYTALAARDLIDTTPGWTQLAYDRIRLRYERAFGETLHPDDQPLPGIAYVDGGLRYPFAPKATYAHLETPTPH